MTDTAAADLRQLIQRASDVATLIAAADLSPIDPGCISDWPGAPVIVTGAGASEGSAMLLLALIAEQGGAGWYWPLSRFARLLCSSDRRIAERAILVVFSQGLSPNAQLALRQRDAFHACAVISARDPQSEPVRELFDGGQTPLFLRHDPQREDGLLVRVCGPPLASLQAIRLARALANSAGPSIEQVVARATACYQDLRQLVPEDVDRTALLGRVALLTADSYRELASGIAWQWMEGLFRGPAPVFDLLQMAHGPLQAMYQEKVTLFVPMWPGYPDKLLARATQVLDGERHTIVKMPAQLPAPLCYLEHQAFATALLIQSLERHKRSLSEWPGKGRDGPLYQLDVPEGD